MAQRVNAKSVVEAASIDAACLVDALRKHTTQPLSNKGSGRGVTEDYQVLALSLEELQSSLVLYVISHRQQLHTFQGGFEIQERDS
ncbi:hypothetical protein DPMN_030836 [Dreissena polymorpha]|uniref:Uncharacterized protein n=1 Tax=Dreissena polymorpha TaxID=45954 RepID=A0A9D4RHG4_DREPO|nr:hypothetical protein DPMN_030836 [Dreissena polymorpha]